MSKLLVFSFLFAIMSLSVSAKVRLFESEGILDAKLEMNISYFRKNKENLREKGIPGTLTVDGKSYFVEVLSRGHGSIHNEHPPFKLKFNKKENEGTLFEDIKKIKAFTNPDGISKNGEKEVLSNYLTYKLIEKVTKQSFKTRLFSIKYIDTAGIIESFESKTFLKEANKNIAKRFNMTYVPFKVGGPNNPTVRDIKTKLHTQSVELVTAFEFLAGNWDYAIPGIYSGMFNGPALAEKNMKIFKDSSGTYYPVMYDFDMSGFIDRGICWWEIGYDMMRLGRSDHFQNIGPSCDNSHLRLHLKSDLDNYYYKENFVKHFPFMKVKINEWQNDYSNLLIDLSPNYLTNLNKYLSEIESLL